MSRTNAFTMGAGKKILLAITLCLVTSAINAQERPPNILIIVSDDHAFQSIHSYSGKYGITPNIDRLAKEGAIFKNAFVTNSICAPSRAVLLTGKYSHINGHRDNRSRFNVAQDIFPRRLQSGGYQTAWVGKWHLESYPQGFDFWKILPGQGFYYNPDFISMTGDTARVEGYCTEVITEMALQWLNGRDKAKPFCLVVGEKATHRTWMPDIRDLGHFDTVKFKLPATFWDDYSGREAAKKQLMEIKALKLDYDLKLNAEDGFGNANYKRFTSDQQKSWDRYYDRVEEDFINRKLSGKDLTEWKYQRYMRDYMSTALSLDRNIGRMLDYLDEQGISDNTLVVYTSDQGFYLGEHGWYDKRFMYEESMRTPLLMRYPGLIEPGSEIEDLVLNLDLAPTFLSIGGIDVPKSIQGKDLRQLFQSQRQDWRDAIYYHYYEYPDEHRVMPHFGVRTNRYKLIRFYGDSNFWELYDLQTDPSEVTNLYGRSDYSKITSGLKEKLRNLIVSYDDKEALQKMMDGN